jgi:RimJ/RimL family protein N-acetyltransferase
VWSRILRMAKAQVHLRAFRAADDAALRSLFDDPQTVLWNPDPVTDLADWRSRQNAGGDDFVTWAVAAEDDDRFVGTVSVFHIDPDQGTAELGYRVLPAERGRGVATAALGTAASLVFVQRGLRRLELFHAAANVASCTVAERAGFRLEGTLRQSYRYGDGVVHDEHLHARLAGDSPV